MRRPSRARCGAARRARWTAREARASTSAGGDQQRDERRRQQQQHRHEHDLRGDEVARAAPQLHARDDGEARARTRRRARARSARSASAGSASSAATARNAPAKHRFPKRSRRSSFWLRRSSDSSSSRSVHGIHVGVRIGHPWTCAVFRRMSYLLDLRRGRLEHQKHPPRTKGTRTDAPLQLTPPHARGDLHRRARQRGPRVPRLGGRDHDVRPQLQRRRAHAAVRALRRPCDVQARQRRRVRDRDQRLDAQRRRRRRRRQRDLPDGRRDPLEVAQAARRLPRHLPARLRRRSTSPRCASSPSATARCSASSRRCTSRSRCRPSSA